MNKDDKMVSDALEEFGAKNEEEFDKIINETWNIVKCAFCGKEIDALKCDYYDGDPVCLGGCE